MPTLKVSATQFNAHPMESPDDFFRRAESLVHKAASDESQLILFPEYFTLPWLMALNNHDFGAALTGFKAVEPAFQSFFVNLAKKYQITIVAGSAPVQLRSKRVNRSFIFLADGRRVEQDKQHLTRVEKERWSISPGAHRIQFWEWRSAALGVAIGYDIQFPNYTSELTADDVDIILVPSCPPNAPGYWRVRHCAQARAVETQSYVVMSSLFGTNKTIPHLDSFYGRAGFFTPCDLEFPEDGVMALGEPNKEYSLTQTLGIGLLHRVRAEGTVLNRRDLVD